MDRRAWWATVHKGCKESDMTKVTEYACKVTEMKSVKPHLILEPQSYNLNPKEINPKSLGSAQLPKEGKLKPVRELVRSFLDGNANLDCLVMHGRMK